MRFFISYFLLAIIAFVYGKDFILASLELVDIYLGKFKVDPIIAFKGPTSFALTIALFVCVPTIVFLFRFYKNDNLSHAKLYFCAALLILGILPLLTIDTLTNHMMYNNKNGPYHYCQQARLWSGGLSRGTSGYTYHIYARQKELCDKFNVLWQSSAIQTKSDLESYISRINENI